jgi:hypothetical protein
MNQPALVPAFTYWSFSRLPVKQQQTDGAEIHVKLDLGDQTFVLVSSLQYAQVASEIVKYSMLMVHVGLEEDAFLIREVFKSKDPVRVMMSFDLQDAANRQLACLSLLKTHAANFNDRNGLDIALSLMPPIFPPVVPAMTAAQKELAQSWHHIEADIDARPAPIRTKEPAPQIAIKLHEFSVSIPEGINYDDGYVQMRHGTQYTILLRNESVVRCDAEVYIDNQKVGTWRIDGGKQIQLERPAHDTGRFTFYQVGSSEGDTAGIRAGDANGLIRVVFKPEIERYDVRYSLAPGATGLSGRSEQTFTSVPALSYDESKRVTINLRIVIDTDEPRPLFSRATPVPPPV